MLNALPVLAIAIGAVIAFVIVRFRLLRATLIAMVLVGGAASVILGFVGIALGGGRIIGYFLLIPTGLAALYAGLRYLYPLRPRNDSNA